MIFFEKVTTEKLRQPTDQITNPTRPDPTFKKFFFGFPTRPDIQNRWWVPTLVCHTKLVQLHTEFDHLYVKFDHLSLG